MDTVERLIGSGLKSPALKEQVFLLKRARDDISSIMKFSHFSKSEIISLSYMYEFLIEMAFDHDQALTHAIDVEATVAKLTRDAVAQVTQLVEALPTAGRIAFVIRFYPGKLATHHLTERADATRLVGEFLQTAIQSQAAYAASQSQNLGTGLKVAIDKMWQDFGNKRAGIEKQYARRIKSHEAQLAFVASHRKANMTPSMPIDSDGALAKPS